MSGTMRYRSGLGGPDEPRERAAVTLKCSHPTEAPPVVTYPGPRRNRDLYLCPVCNTHKTRR